MSKLAYDSDEETSNRAIIGLGLIGAGTNNSRLAGTLRSLASYFGKESNTLYLIRIAQGMVHMGKVREMKMRWNVFNGKSIQKIK